MSAENSFASLQIYRSVIETPGLLRFLEKVDDIGFKIFRPGQAVLPVEVEGAENIVFEKPRGVRRHRLYDSESLKLLLLDRRGPRDMYDPLSRAYKKLTSQTSLQRRKTSFNDSDSQTFTGWEQDINRALAERGLPLQGLKAVKFSTIGFMSNPDYGAVGTDISLMQRPNMTALQFKDESNICFDALARINPRLAYPTPKTLAEIAFIRLPKTATSEEIVDFANEVEKHLPIALDLGTPRVAVSA